MRAFCTTASLTRQIKPGLKHEPKPLCSLRCPMGLPNLKHVQKERARLANRLYRLTKRFLKMLQLQNIGWPVENPAGSLMWVRSLCGVHARVQHRLYWPDFSHLHVWSASQKQIALWTNIPELCQLRRPRGSVGMESLLCR